MDNQVSINHGIPTPYIKHVPVIPLVLNRIFFNPPFYFGGSFITENRKVHKQNSHINMKFKGR